MQRSNLAQQPDSPRPLPRGAAAGSPSLPAMSSVPGTPTAGGGTSMAAAAAAASSNAGMAPSGPGTDDVRNTVKDKSYRMGLSPLRLSTYPEGFASPGPEK